MKSIIEAALSTISKKELEDRIFEFESFSSRLGYEDALEALKRVILFEASERGLSAFKAEAREYKVGSIFYRARKLKRGALDFKHSDFWEAPRENIGRGRLNRPMEQLLYMSPSEPYTPINEALVGSDDQFLLIAYEAVCPLSVFGIGVGGDFDGEFTPETENKLDIISGFIKRNFLKNGDTAYILSNVIAQEICRYDYDGWLYPSVANEGGENICLKLPAKEKLEIQSAYICELVAGKINPMKALKVGDEILIFDDWGANNSAALKIFDGLMISLNKDRGFEAETRDDIGFPVNVLEPDAFDKRKWLGELLAGAPNFPLLRALYKKGVTGVNKEIIGFLKDLPPPNKGFNDYEFFLKGAIYLEDQLRDYLATKGLSANSFNDAISKARAINNPGTNRKFWNALDTFRLVRNAYAHPKNAPQSTKRKWIRFINIIEGLMGYKGCQLFPVKNIRSRRVFRLYLSYMLAWEHIRYIAGNDDGYSPSAEILKAYGNALSNRGESNT